MFIEKYILSKEAKKLFEQNFLKKFDNLKDLIKIYSNDDKIYNCEDNEEFLGEQIPENQGGLKEENPLSSSVKKGVESVENKDLNKKTDVKGNEDVPEKKVDRGVDDVSKKNDSEKSDDLPGENNGENEEDLPQKNLSVKDEDFTKNNLGENIANNDEDIAGPAPSPIPV